MIYFIQEDETLKIKIGFSKKALKRLSSLQTANPHKLRLLGSIEGTLKEEALYHDKFTAHRLNGEWFKSDILADVLEIIAKKGNCAETPFDKKIISGKTYAVTQVSELPFEHHTLICLCVGEHFMLLRGHHCEDSMSGFDYVFRKTGTGCVMKLHRSTSGADTSWRPTAKLRYSFGVDGVLRRLERSRKYAYPDWRALRSACEVAIRQLDTAVLKAEMASFHRHLAWEEMKKAMRPVKQTVGYDTPTFKVMKVAITEVK